MTAALDVLEWGPERARAGPWRGDGRVAYLAPLPPAPAPSADFLRRCLATLAGRGYREVITSALGPREQDAFLAVGFEPHQRLHLLAHDLQDLPEGPPVALRRARAADRVPVLAVDAAAFSPFWRLDPGGLDDALAATPATRLRVAGGGGGRGGPVRPVVGYALSGRAGGQGYLQRLAVAPAARRSGMGSALSLDALRWMRRRGARRAVVNTQLGNDAALRLYLGLGFRMEPSDLAVLHRGLPG